MCFIDDLARALRCSTATIKRRLRVGTFPIPSLPSIDSRRRWAGEDVRQFIARRPGRAAAPGGLMWIALRDVGGLVLGVVWACLRVASEVSPL